jgi:hypothetical protein
MRERALKETLLALQPLLPKSRSERFSPLLSMTDVKLTTLYNVLKTLRL